MGFATLAPHCVRCSAGVTNDSGTLTSRQRYLPFGQLRTDVTSPSGPTTDLSYTGQRDLGMGLMDYHARFYSSYITHFSQPDTLISSLYNPQSLNRYAYVSNRPINFNDPSGHCVQEGDAPKGSVSNKNICPGLSNGGNGWANSAPDTLDEKKLGPQADKFNQLYVAMWKDQEGWWWNKYGGKDGFTIWDFMSVMWGYDVQFDNPLLVEAMHNRASPFCPGNCDPSTPEGSLTYLAGYAQSARDRVGRWQPGTDPALVMDDAVPDMQAGLNVVNAIRTSTGLGLHSMSPFDYGNISLNPLFGKMVSKGWVLYSQPASNGDTFFILSLCHYYFAQDVIQNGRKVAQDSYAEFCP